MWPSTSRHGLYRIPSGQCPQSFTPTPGNGIVALVPAANGGSFTTPALVPGVYWFACPVSHFLPCTRPLCRTPTTCLLVDMLPYLHASEGNITEQALQPLAL